ncbi:response regulator [Cohnella herbarum]|uniref:Response regulator n=1 Tax=Cohnella herbarum TaxID=2728023 RepID=A0A7Z2VFD4_9BACL|nr:response regulator [Cohnella herbarum]QJD81987.1 response regulator [Cohnella herbarum]
MRQVIIVDDERWIRRGLIGAIPWDEMGLELVGEAGDGQDAYDMAIERKPDLLFLDMRMPGLDGKQLLGMLRRDLPDLLTIVVSGYSDFEYTKEAIRFGAFDYLLKPVKKEELTSVLEKACFKLEERDAIHRGQQNGQGENWLWNALFYSEQPNQSGHDAGIKPPRGWLDNPFVLLVALPDRYCDRYETQQRVAWLQKKLMADKGFYFNGSWEFVITTGLGGTGEIVMTVAGGPGVLNPKDMLPFISVLQNQLKQLGNVSYSVGVNLKVESVATIQLAYKQAKQLLSGKKLGESGAVLYRTSNSEQRSYQHQYPQLKEDVLLLTLQTGNEDATNAEFNRFYEAISDDGMTVDHLQRCSSMLIHSIERLLQAAHSSLEEVSGKGSLSYTELIQVRNDAVSIREIFDCCLIPAVIKYYSNPRANQGEQIVKEIQKLIEVQYAQALSLQNIAESRFLNPDYLSRLFKKTTGRNFVDYLTDYRIAKSIEYLKYTNHKNYEIASKVGYEDYRYFSQIFKKKTGMTIGQFRSTHAQNLEKT